jgi:hypothetical protein
MGLKGQLDQAVTAWWNNDEDPDVDNLAVQCARLALEHLIIKHVKIINGQHGPIESINPEAVRNLLADLSTEGGRHG